MKPTINKLLLMDVIMPLLKHRNTVQHKAFEFWNSRGLFPMASAEERRILMTKWKWRKLKK